MSDPESAGWTPETLKAVMDERDKRYEQRFQASQKAIDESKEDIKAKLANTNEWRQTFADRESKYMTKAEAFALISMVGGVVGVLLEILNFAMFQHK